MCCVATDVCLETVLGEWVVYLDVAVWSMEPNVCKPNNRTKIQMRSRFEVRRWSPVHKILLSGTVSVTLLCLAGDPHLPPPPHTCVHTFTLSAEKEFLKPQRPRPILTIELERLGEYNQHPHWGFSI